MAIMTMPSTISFVCPSKDKTVDVAKSIIRQIVEQAETNHGFICISGYRSDTGRICNYVLQPYGADAYPRLLRESLLMLEKGIDDLPTELHGQTIDKEIWNEAVLEQIDSFRKSLNGGHGREDRKVKIDKAFYELDGTVYVANVRIVSIHETEEQKAHNIRLREEIENKDIPKSPKAKAKKYLRGITPVGNFRGQFRLDADKFDRIAFAGTVIEFSDYGQLFTAGN